MTRSSNNGAGITRRHAIEIGYSSMMGAGLSALLEQRSSANDSFRPRPAKSVLFLFLFGGPSHIDTFDMKPGAPDEVRGEFRPIDTSASGVQVCEHLPNLAQRMHHWSIVRSMTCHPSFGDHRMAVHGLLGGVDELPPGSNLAASRRDWPCWCSGVEYFRKSRNGLPSSVVLPGDIIDPGTGLYPAQNAGLLGSRFDPFAIRGNPADANYRVDESLKVPAGMSVDRLASRKTLLASLDHQTQEWEAALDASPYDESRHEAFRMLSNGRLAKALAIDDEPASLRDRYGRHQFGQTILVAKRLIEAGIPIVQANISYQALWDTHYNNFKSLLDLLPHLDRGVSALIDDMSSSGLLDETLIVMMGEFGRTPKLIRPDGILPYFTTPGRDHWMTCFSGLFAGAGVQGGTVIGRSDPIAAYPLSRPYRHSDVAATVYSALGIDPTAEIVDLQGRPLQLNRGQVIEALYTGRES